MTAPDLPLDEAAANIQRARDRALLISQQDSDAPKLTQRLDAQAMATLVAGFDALRARVAELEQRERDSDKAHACQVARVEILLREKAELEQERASMCNDIAARVAENFALQARANALRDALREFTPEGVPHNGVAFALREFAKARQYASGKWDGRSQTLVEWAIAIENALAQTPAASLAAHDAEVLERAAKLADAASHEPGAQGYSGGPKYVDMMKLAKAIRALAAQEVKK